MLLLWISHYDLMNIQPEIKCLVYIGVSYRTACDFYWSLFVLWIFIWWLLSCCISVFFLISTLKHHKGCPLDSRHPHCSRCCLASSRAWKQNDKCQRSKMSLHGTEKDGEGKHITTEREPSEWHSRQSRLLAVWPGSRLSRSGRHRIQSFQVSLRGKGREGNWLSEIRSVVCNLAISNNIKLKKKLKTDKILTFWLCHQNIGIYLPFLIGNFISRINWTDAIVSGFFVAIKLQVTPTNLMKQPGLLQTTADQRNLLLPAALKTYREKKLK